MLTEDQLAAVKSDARVTKVVAGAGSGKTRVIVERVRHMLSSGIAPERILVFTFTRKAANEIKTRLGNDAVKVGTFHSIALDLLNAESHYVPISEGMSNAIIDSINATMKKPISAKLVHGCRENRKLGKPSGSAEIQRAADTFEARLAHDRAVDFLGMILKAIDVAEGLPAYHVIVDESQDTDDLQWKLVDTLRKDASDFTVGDAAQTLYAFRGIDPEAWLSRYADRIVELNDTFRFGESIESVSREVLKKIDMERVIRTHVAVGSVLTIIQPAMVDAIAGFNIESCAVLCRYNDQAAQVREWLKANGIKVSERITIDHSAALALFRYLSAPWCGVAHGEFLANKKASKLLPTLASDELSTESCAIIAKSWLDSLESPTVGAVIAQLKVPDSLKESFAWWNNHYAGMSLQSAVRDFATLDAVDQYTEGVQVMTMHSSKGLEFDDVVCVFPPVRKFSAEEWRVAYVALTRAKRNLVVVGENNPVVELVEQWLEQGVLA